MNPRLPQPNGLAKLVYQPGGLAMADAVRAAETNLAGIRGAVVTEITATLDRMLAIGTTDPDAHALDELYNLANSVVGLAGLFGMAGLGQVCFSLCELLDRLRSQHMHDNPALRVHMESLHLLRPGLAHDEAKQAAVVAALQRVVTRV